MKVAIMQPYFFPYQGYFNLINSVDLFVIYDDVNYIKRGWVNRNYILLNGQKKMITIPLVDLSQNKYINSIQVGQSRSKLIKLTYHAYCKARYFKDIFPIIECAMNYDESNLASYLTRQLKLISNYLGINTRFILSSEIEKDNNIRGAEKIISICNKLGADTYLNLPGGINLYENSDFLANNIELKFVSHEPRKYFQLSDEWHPNLSIIDLIMNVKKSDLPSYII